MQKIFVPVGELDRVATKLFHASEALGEKLQTMGPSKDAAWVAVMAERCRVAFCIAESAAERLHELSEMFDAESNGIVVS